MLAGKARYSALLGFLGAGFEARGCVGRGIVAARSPDIWLWADWKASLGLIEVSSVDVDSRIISGQHMPGCGECGLKYPMRVDVRVLG